MNVRTHTKIGGNMELKVWSKTLLNVYGCLQKLTEEIDKIVLNFALSTGYVNYDNKTYRDTQKILELTERKITLINIKILIEKCLDKIDLKYCKLLTLKYVDKVSNETIASALNIKYRTYFRKFMQAIDSFASRLKFEGFTQDKIFNLVKKEEWILDIYNATKEKELKKGKDESINKYAIFNLAVKDYKKERKLLIA